MKKIKHLVEQIREELHDAEKYAEASLKNKNDDSALSSVYRQLAEQKLEHSHILHAQVVRVIREHEGEPPAVMQAIWNWEHEQIIKEEHAVKMLLSME